MKIIIEPIKINKKDQQFLQEQAISFRGVVDLVNTNIIDDYVALLIMQYLTHKKQFIQKQINLFKEKIQQYNQAVQLAQQVDIKQNLNGEPLQTIEIELHKKF